MSMVFYSHFFLEELEVSVCCVLALSLVAVELYICVQHVYVQINQTYTVYVFMNLLPYTER